MIDIREQLNNAQVAAATHTQGPLLVIAGAGSGKTRVITYRIVNLINAHRVAPWRIMAVTFTNKAAREMAERISHLLGDDARCWISTFHASCARILRKYGEQAGVNPRFTIYDDSDQKAMIARVLKELNITTKQVAPRAIQSEINRAKRELIGPADYPESDYYRTIVKQVFERYETHMNAANALDFGDLLYRTVSAMQTNKALAEEIADQFDYVMVDEFQDTNRVQLELIRMLTPHKNICVVGDDDQSIYSWRGARVSNILDFETLFPGAQVVTLDRNYRSTEAILKAAHAVVSKLNDRRPKELWTSQAGGNPVTIMTASDEREEARIVARKIKELNTQGVSLEEQVVFYRTNAQSRVFEEVFRSQNIPHRVVGGMRFYERAEVKDLLAYLRLVRNPADHTAFVRIVNTPTRGIGKTTVDKLVTLAAAHGESAFEAITRAPSFIGGAAAKKLTSFFQMVNRWQDALLRNPSDIFAVATQIIDDTGYILRLREENTAESDARMENIEELLGSIQDFEQEAETPNLDTFLELVTLQTDVDTANFQEKQATLMTVHAAKGLEFDVVFVTGMEEGLFPLIRRNDQEHDNMDEQDEERRLAYVAMTRARQQLFLTRATHRHLYGQWKINPPSRFLGNIPRDITVSMGDSPPVRLVQPYPRAAVGGNEASTFLGTHTASSSSTPRSHTSSNWGRSPSSPPSRPGFTQLRKKNQKSRPDSTWIDPSMDQSQEATLALTPGQMVSHAKFGQGKVMGVIPGPKPKAEVVFPGFGRKTLLIKFLDTD